MSEFRRGQESITIRLARFQERLEGLISSNTESHKQLLAGQENLCIHVNHEIEVMSNRIQAVETHGSTPLREVIERLLKLVDKIDSRVCILENHDLAEVNKYKGRMELFKWISIVLSIMLGVGAVLKLLNLL